MIATASMNNDEIPSVKDVCLFLSEYGAWLVGCGATCIRLEKNVRRIAAAYGMKVEMTIMPRHIHMNVCDDCGENMFTSIIAVPSVPISFDVNTALSRLSWNVADRKIGFGVLKRRFCNIIHSGSRDQTLMPVVVGMANAAFCRLFGGDAAAMAVVAVATIVGFYIRQICLAGKMDYRAVVLICSFVSAVLGATDGLFALGATPEVAIGTSVLYLVPGIPFLNAFSDMFYRHYICAFSRFIDALIITCCLSAGLCCGMLMMGRGMF